MQQRMASHPHLMVEDLALARLGRLDEVFVEHIENILADLGELGLDLLAVLLDGWQGL